MREVRSILLLDGGARRLEPLARRLAGLGFRTQRAKTPDEAARLMEDGRYRFGAAALAPDVAAADLRAALADLNARSSEGPLVWVALGPRPDDGEIVRLREAGVRLALWEPFADGALRFQMNRALAGPGEGAPRREVRVPVELPGRVEAAGRRKPVQIYTLSATGAFLETPRPSLSGARVAVELPLAPDPVHVLGRVVYTNVPGNLRKRELPVGMAVAFSELDELTERLIRRRVAETAPRLVI